MRVYPLIAAAAFAFTFGDHVDKTIGPWEANPPNLYSFTSSDEEPRKDDCKNLRRLSIKDFIISKTIFLC